MEEVPLYTLDISDPHRAITVLHQVQIWCLQHLKPHIRIRMKNVCTRILLWYILHFTDLFDIVNFYYGMVIIKYNILCNLLIKV